MYERQTSLKATNAEFSGWKAAAKAANMPLTTWIRCILDAASGQSELFQQVQRAAIAQQVEHAEHMRTKIKAKKAEG